MDCHVYLLYTPFNTVFIALMGLYFRLQMPVIRPSLSKQNIGMVDTIIMLISY